MDLTNDGDPTVEHDPDRRAATSQDGVVEHPTAERLRSMPGRCPRTGPGSSSAVFYEVLVRAFYDSSSDGSGDLRGLIERLDYLQWLGVDCLWLPPFYDSPLRDGGYDIRDFYQVLPEFGTVEDFVALLDAAHKRGIRVITDLVMNHTSDQHPWFQESRRDPDGPVRRLLRLERHQREVRGRPGDLRGHRGVELDVRPGAPAVLLAPVLLPPARPELRQPGRAARRCSTSCGSGSTWASTASGWTRCRTCSSGEGTNCENLPETHAFLKHCRKVIDDEFPGRVLLAEANQWPADVVEYFGDPSTGGDECHMAFHFPLMPRHLHGGTAGVALPDLGDPGADAGHPGRTASGASSCATTTS